MNRKPYPSDVSNEEWAFAAPYLTLMREDAPQRDFERLPETLKGLHFLAFACVMLTAFVHRLAFLLKFITRSSIY